MARGQDKHMISHNLTWTWDRDGACYRAVIFIIAARAGLRHWNRDNRADSATPARLRRKPSQSWASNKVVLIKWDCLEWLCLQGWWVTNANGFLACSIPASYLLSLHLYNMTVRFHFSIGICYKFNETKEIQSPRDVHAVSSSLL